MANKTRMIRKTRKAPERKSGPGLQERLKRLSDSAPVAELRGGSSAFYNDHEIMRFKDK